MGLGSRKTGLLPAAICSLVCRRVVIPTGNYMIMAITESRGFQNLAGRRVQRLPLRSPNNVSHHALGWMQIDIDIQAKK